jgi:hypothetical protein
MQIFVQQRPAIQRAQLMNQFGLTSTYQLAVTTPDATQGSVRINSLQTRDLAERTGKDGVWTGTYFAGVPLELEAVAKPCYAFKRWHGIGAAQATARITVGQNLSVRAEFEAMCTP